MSTTIKIEGLKELGVACRALPVAVEKKVLGKSVFFGTILIKADAMRRAPVDTGTLQQAVLVKRIRTEPMIARYIITVRHGVKAQEVKKFGGVVNLDAYYWTFQEFGTSKMPAHPFMRPAFESNKNLALGVIIENLSAGVELEAKALAWSRPT